METISLHQEIIQKLHNTYKIIGYVTEESVFDAIIEHALPLDEVDYVCDCLLAMGVIIHDDSVENSDDEEDEYDRSQIDYGKLFQEIVAIDESLDLFIEEIRQIRPPQHREWQNLILQAKNDNLFAKQRIIEMYLRTVVRIALWHHQKFKIPLAETIQDGCVGLVIALNKYEVGKQDKFSTYAPWWIRQNIIRAAPALNPLIYIPVHVKDKLFSIYDIIEHFDQHGSNKVCSEMLETVSEKLGCCESEAKQYINYLNTFDSIEEMIEKDGSFFSDSCAAEEQIFIELNRKELKSAITKVLKSLKPREEKVILLRFGFIDGREWTLEEVGNEFGVTRERIRQIEKKAFGKLRNINRSKILKLFMD